MKQITTREYFVLYALSEGCFSYRDKHGFHTCHKSCPMKDDLSWLNRNEINGGVQVSINPAPHKKYIPSEPRMVAAFFLMDIQEDAWILAGCRKFKGYAQLQRIIEYLVNTD